MVRPITKTVSTDVSSDDIDAAMKELRNGVGEKAELRAIERLLFIKMRLQGVEMSKAMAVLGITKPTAYQWQNEWNEKGLDSIVPNYAGGASRRLSDEQLDEVKSAIAERCMTTEEVQEFIQDRFDVKYTKKQIAVRMRELGLHFAKPYDKDYRSPEDAEQVLKKTSPGQWHV